MRSSKIRARLRQGKAVRIAALCNPVNMMPAHAAKAGYDAIWLDTEHSTWDRRELQRLLAFHHLADIDCILRTGSRNPTELYHFLEDGATALMIPHVNSAEEARQLVKAVRFPPLGERGMDGSSIDNSFYTNGITGYTAAANAETFLMLQIETPEAVACVEEIAAVPGVDGFFVGPADLSLRLGCPMDWKQPGMAAAQARIAAAAAKHGVAWGRPTWHAADIKELYAAGGRLIAHGSDLGAIFTMMPQYSRVLDEGLGESR